ncbi:MAG: RNA methyltransferase [Oscillospiraceae bacterium]|nr:RNA methyltransferase [Oscillospiraceae bacterium]
MPQTDILQIGSQNKTLHTFTHLNRSRSYREKCGLFAMEGYRLVLDAIGCGAELSAILLSETAQKTYGAEIAAAAPNVRRLLVSDALAKEIADTDTAQGVFAIAKMRQELEALPQTKSRCLLLHCLQDPANLGAILRTADALGTDGVYLYQCCDLYNPKTVRSTMGALFRVPIRRIRNMDEFFGHCRNIQLPTCAAVVDRDAKPLQKYDFSGGAVVMIGNEGNGLPREVSDACTAKLTIPMSAQANSLNAAMAAGLFLWEMTRYRE